MPQQIVLRYLFGIDTTFVVWFMCKFVWYSFFDLRFVAIFVFGFGLLIVCVRNLFEGVVYKFFFFVLGAVPNLYIFRESYFGVFEIWIMWVSLHCFCILPIC